MASFCTILGITDETRIIDVGGTEFNWTLIPQKPFVTIVNLDIENQSSDKLVHEIGDGTCLKYPDNSFDVAFSNSVIEHVGDWEKQKAFAREIRRVAPKYYIQTPNRHFFFEPHLLAPFIHWLPISLRIALARHLTGWGLLTKPTRDRAEKYIRSIRLLSVGEMKDLFPGDLIVRERFLFLTKSIVVVRR